MGEGIFHPHIAPVPGLVYHAGGGLPLLRPAEDKTILRSVGGQPLVGAGIGKAGGLFGAVRAEDVRRIAGGLLAGIGRRADAGGIGRSPLFGKPLFQIHLLPGIKGRFPCGNILIARHQFQRDAVCRRSCRHGAVLLCGFRFQLLARGIIRHRKGRGRLCVQRQIPVHQHQPGIGKVQLVFGAIVISGHKVLRPRDQGVGLGQQP